MAIKMCDNQSSDDKNRRESVITSNVVSDITLNCSLSPNQATACIPSLQTCSEVILGDYRCVLKDGSQSVDNKVAECSHELSQNSSNSEETTNTLNVKNDLSGHLECQELCSSGTSEDSSTQRLCNTKRRAGVLYRQLKSSKLRKVSSQYFNQAHNTQKRWVPPRSPYALVQEDLFDNPWQLLVATIFLTKTAAKRALPQLHKFLTRFPRPEDILQAKYEDIDDYFQPLGLKNTRSHIVMRFTVEYLEKDWTYPRELYGIGKYGDDSYRMFCINEWRQVSPDDIPLTMYRNWLLENADRLGIN